MKTGVLKFLHTSTQFIPPMLISKIITSISTLDTIEFSGLRAIAYAMSLYFVLCLKTIFESHYVYGITSVAAKMRGAISTAMYSKLLNLNVMGRDKLSVCHILQKDNLVLIVLYIINTMCNVSYPLQHGKLVNLLTLDTHRIEQMAMSLHLLWDGAYQVRKYD